MIATLPGREGLPRYGNSGERTARSLAIAVPQAEHLRLQPVHRRGDLIDAVHPAPASLLRMNQQGGTRMKPDLWELVAFLGVAIGVLGPIIYQNVFKAPKSVVGTVVDKLSRPVSGWVPPVFPGSGGPLSTGGTIYELVLRVNSIERTYTTSGSIWAEVSPGNQVKALIQDESHIAWVRKRL